MTTTLTRTAVAALSLIVCGLIGQETRAGAQLAKVGAAAPVFEASDSRGAKHSLGDYAGKFVVLEWINHGCPFFHP